MYLHGDACATTASGGAPSILACTMARFGWVCIILGTATLSVFLILQLLVRGNLGSVLAFISCDSYYATTKKGIVPTGATAAASGSTGGYGTSGSILETECQRRTHWLEEGIAPTATDEGFAMDGFEDTCLIVRRACLVENDIVLMGPPQSESSGSDTTQGGGGEKSKRQIEIEEPAKIREYSLGGDRNVFLEASYNLPGWYDGLPETQTNHMPLPLNIRVRSSLDPPELLSWSPQSNGSDDGGGSKTAAMSQVPVVLFWRPWQYNFGESAKWMFDLASFMLHGHSSAGGSLSSTDTAKQRKMSSWSDTTLGSTILGLLLVTPIRSRIAPFWQLLEQPGISRSVQSYYDAARYCPQHPPPCFEKMYICGAKTGIPIADSAHIEKTIDRMVEGSCLRDAGNGEPLGDGDGDDDDGYDKDTLRVWIDDTTREGPKKREILNPGELFEHCQKETFAANGRTIKLICHRGSLTDSAKMACAIRRYDVLIAITGASVANGLFLHQGGSIIQVEHEEWSAMADEDNWGGHPLLKRIESLQPLHYRAPPDDTEDSPMVDWYRRQKMFSSNAAHRDASIRVSWAKLVPLLEKAVEFRDGFYHSRL